MPPISVIFTTAIDKYTDARYGTYMNPMSIKDTGLRGRSQTNVVHVARVDGVRGGYTLLAPKCGMGRRVRAYLFPVDGQTPVTCAKCEAYR